MKLQSQPLNCITEAEKYLFRISISYKYCNKESNGSLNCDVLNFFISLVYIRWYVVNPYVQRVQNMYDKGGRGTLRPSYGRPKVTLVSRFVATKLWRYKKLTHFHFSSETNRPWESNMASPCSIRFNRSNEIYKSVNFL